MGVKMGKICHEAHVFGNQNNLLPAISGLMPPVCGPALQEIINQMTTRLNEVKEKVRIEMESCKLVLPPATFSALERKITCECRTKNLVRGEFYVQAKMQLYR